MKKNIEKKIRQKLQQLQKKYSHDIKYIDGRFVEEVVREYQETKNEDLLLKIIDNYSIFANEWAYDFAQYCDNDPVIGETMFKEIIWFCADRFKACEALKPNGRAFNAYLVSALLNQLKNQFSARISHKNHPRVICPVCSQKVYQIDQKHLKHIVNLQYYGKKYRKYPLVSTDGDVISPITGEIVDQITESHINRINCTYTVKDFHNDFADQLPKFPVTCPITLMQLKSVSGNYPSSIRSGYTEQEFINDYPDFAGIIKCPFTGKKMLEITQEYLDKVLGQKIKKRRMSLFIFNNKYPNITIKAKKIPVLNPYTKKMVPEITAQMLVAAGTTITEHLEKYCSYTLGKKSMDTMLVCPFTGRKTRRITKEDLQKIGRNQYEFYMAICEYPLQKWLVKCAICGEYVENIWNHLSKANHVYAKSMTMDEFKNTFGSCSTKAVVSTNSFYSNESGDSIHVADLIPHKTENLTPLEIEDSLNHVATDDLDRRIIKAVRSSHSLDDICYSATDKKEINIPFQFVPGKSKVVREVIRKITGIDDFDFVKPPETGTKRVQIMTPGRDAIRLRLLKMVENSDLMKD